MNKCTNILIIADFPICKSGIGSTAKSILSQPAFEASQVFCDQDVGISRSFKISKLRETDKKIDVIFTHLEYSQLSGFQKKYPNAVIHVGDWSPKYWDSVKKESYLKGLFGGFRANIRIRKLKKDSRFAFVSEEDWKAAVTSGFRNSIYLPIGVTPSKTKLSERLDSNLIYFSGNFRYPPNRQAAVELMRIAKENFAEKTFTFVGYYADELPKFETSNLKYFPDVPSVVDVLAEKRGLYVSLLKTGAGAKNKILEAIIGGCPIICTNESIDSSIPAGGSIKVVNSRVAAIAQILEWSVADITKKIAIESAILSKDFTEKRSWQNVAARLNDIIVSY